MPRYPDIEPYETGLLDTGDGNLVYWETCGNPDGVPALIVHGGPGSGCTAGNRRLFDPEKFRIVIFDQLNCGRSLPHASDPAADMSLNTTGHLLRDMEQLREHLGVEKWLLRGGSWGVTLSLAYAERHPDRVSGMLMLSVTSTRRLEIDWLYRGVGRFFPEAWARFRDFAGLTDSYRLPTDTTPPITHTRRNSMGCGSGPAISFAVRKIDEPIMPLTSSSTESSRLSPRTSVGCELEVWLSLSGKTEVGSIIPFRVRPAIPAEYRNAGKSPTNSPRKSKDR